MAREFWCSSRTSFSERRPSASAFSCRQRVPMAWANCSRPRIRSLRARCEEIVAKVLSEEGLPLLGWRDVPVNNKSAARNRDCRRAMHRQVFVGRPRTSWMRRLRACPLSRAARHLEPVIAELGQQGRQLLSRVPILPYHRLQGHVPVLSARANITSTCTIRASSPHWRWSISGSRQTHSRPGASLTPTA